MRKFGHEWMMFFAAHRVAGKSVGESEEHADTNLAELVALRIPLESVWDIPDSQKLRIRVLVVRHDAGRVQIQMLGVGSTKWFEPIETFLDPRALQDV